MEESLASPTPDHSYSEDFLVLMLEQNMEFLLRRLVHSKGKIDENVNSDLLVFW